MKLAVIGLGSIAPYFLEAIAGDPGCELVAVCDTDSEKLARWAGMDVRVFANHEKLLAAEVVDGVIITVANDLHAPIAEAALRAGVHVCCEKPLTLGTGDAERLVAASEESGAVLFTAFHRRYNRHVQRLADEVASADDDVVAVRAHYNENIFEHIGGDRWYLDIDRCGGGCLVDNGPNALDAIRHVVGPIALEDATIGDVRAGVEFCAELSLNTADGAPVHVELDWSFSGERKDISVELGDGRLLIADMLDGYTEFKSSLTHEYVGVVADFCAAVAADGYQDGGPSLVTLVENAYKLAHQKERRTRMRAKAPIGAALVKLLFHRLDDRGMRLAPWGSRCVRAGELHEIVLTVDEPRRPGDRIDRVSFLGFAAFETAGVIDRGDEVWLRDSLLGTVVGFDDCHAPNHLNVVVETQRLRTAADVDAGIGDRLRFVEAPSSSRPADRGATWA